MKCSQLKKKIITCITPIRKNPGKWFIGTLIIVISACLLLTFFCSSFGFKHWPLGGLFLTFITLIIAFIKLASDKDGDRHLHEVILDPRKSDDNDVKKNGFLINACILGLMFLALVSILASCFITVFVKNPIWSNLGFLCIALCFIGIDLIILARLKSVKDTYKDFYNAAKEMHKYADRPAAVCFFVLILVSLPGLTQIELNDFCCGSSAGIMIYGNAVISYLIFGL